MTLDGTSISLNDLRGDVVLLNFWGTWCLPCQREMPELQDLYLTYGDVNFTVLGLAVRDTAEAVAAFRDANAITFPLALDENNLVTNAYAVPGQPTTILLDENGVILKKFYSVTTADQLDPLVLNALEQ
jgi:peroxiredoxin